MPSVGRFGGLLDCMSSTPKVVITGMGVVCPIGVGKAAFWESLCAHRSGVRPCHFLDGTDMPVRFGAELIGFDAKQYVRPRKSLKVMCREIQMGFAASVLAAEDARLAADSVDPDRLGAVFGSEMFYGELEELEEVYRNCMPNGHFEFDRWGPRAMSDLFPLWMLKYLPNMAACHIGIAHDARGPNNTITLGEASSLLAITEAVRVIERGMADVMITGGTGSRLNVTAMMYRGDGNLSHRNDDPAAASRPFDSARDGMVNGEGAGAFIVERYEHAVARGASILAELRGCGGAFEPGPPGSPRTGIGMRHAIQRALEDAEVTPSEIGHVNAHGLSTIEDDAAEAQVIRECLGDTPVTALKSYFGNLGAGGGTVEMAASLLAFEHGHVPPTLNYERPDPLCPIHVIHGAPAPVQSPVALILNQSGTGQAAALVIAAP